MRLRRSLARLGATLVLLADVASQHRPHHHHHGHHGHHHGLLPFYEYDDALELEGGRLEPPPRRRRRRKRRRPGVDAAEHVELAHTTSDDATLRLIERVNEQHRRASLEHRPAMLMQESSINGLRTTRTKSKATADSRHTHTHTHASPERYHWHTDGRQLSPRAMMPAGAAQLQEQPVRGHDRHRHAAAAVPGDLRHGPRQPVGALGRVRPAELRHARALRRAALEQLQQQRQPLQHPVRHSP